MSDKNKNIQPGSESSDFLVPDGFFTEQKMRFFNGAVSDDFYTPSGPLNKLPWMSEDYEFSVPNDFFPESKKHLMKTIDGRKSSLFIWSIVTSAAAILLLSLLIWKGSSTDQPSFHALLAESEIEPHDLLLEAAEDEIYWAYIHLSDTVIADSSWVLQGMEKLDPKTGLPISKVKELNQISWDDITPADALEYLRENNVDDENFN